MLSGQWSSTVLYPCVVSLLYNVEASLHLDDKNTSTRGEMIHVFTLHIIVLVSFLLFHLVYSPSVLQYLQIATVHTPKCGE